MLRSWYSLSVRLLKVPWVILLCGEMISEINIFKLYLVLMLMIAKLLEPYHKLKTLYIKIVLSYRCHCRLQFWYFCCRESLAYCSVWNKLVSQLNNNILFVFCYYFFTVWTALCYSGRTCLRSSALYMRKWSFNAVKYSGCLLFCRVHFSYH